jgi:hypothetical protein
VSMLRPDDRLRAISVILICGTALAWQPARGAQWQDVLGQMPLTPSVVALNRSNTIPVLLESLQSNAVIKALVILPAVTDDFYLINRDKPPLNIRARNLLEAISALTNATAVRVAFRSPLLLLHLDRDHLDPVVSVRNSRTADRLRQKCSVERALFCDRAWDALQPTLIRSLAVTVLPKAKSIEAGHLYRVNLAGWNLTDWELLTALSLSSKAGFTVQGNRVVFESTARLLRSP